MTLHLCFPHYFLNFLRPFLFICDFSNSLSLSLSLVSYVTNPAERLGNYYSRYKAGFVHDTYSQFSEMTNEQARENALLLFEELSGLTDIKLGTGVPEEHDDFDGSAKILGRFARNMKESASQRLGEGKEELMHMSRGEMMELLVEYQSGVKQRVRKSVDGMKHRGTELMQSCHLPGQLLGGKLEEDSEEKEEEEEEDEEEEEEEEEEQEEEQLQEQLPPASPLRSTKGRAKSPGKKNNDSV